jgi:hypothetical protein
MTTLADVTASPTNAKAAMKGGRPTAWPTSWARWETAYLGLPFLFCRSGEEGVGVGAVGPGRGARAPFGGRQGEGKAKAPQAVGGQRKPEAQAPPPTS